MLSTFPASSDGLVGFQLPELGFPPWDCQELFPFILQEQNYEPVFSPNPTQEPVHANSISGSDDSDKILLVHKHSKPLELNRKRNCSSSGSDDPTQIEERKRRRMLSNRESARRSRMRKQKHLENLRNEVKRFKIGNRDMMNRLHMVIQHTQAVRKQNERLQVERVMLNQKLWDVNQVLLIRQLQQQLSSSAWPCNNNIMLHQ